MSLERGVHLDPVWLLGVPYIMNMNNSSTFYLRARGRIFHIYNVLTFGCFILYSLFLRNTRWQSPIGFVEAVKLSSSPILEKCIPHLTAQNVDQPLRNQFVDHLSGKITPTPRLSCKVKQRIGRKTIQRVLSSLLRLNSQKNNYRKVKRGMA